MKMRRVVGFANKDSPSPEGFNELTIRVLTEETQEYCGCLRLLRILPSRHKHRALFIFTVSRTALSSA
jgi:hypothetical protein